MISKLFLVFFLVMGTVMGKEIHIKTDDGFRLFGFLYYPEIKKEKYPVIIFAHQFGTTHIIWSSFAKEFREKGFATLLIDLRGHGLSIYQNGKENKIIFKEKFNSLIDLVGFFKKSKEKVHFEKIPDDISLWIDYILDNEKIDPENIFLIGASLGGISIIPVVAIQDIKGVISISPGSISTVGNDRAKLALASYMNPILYVSSFNDPIGSKKTIDTLMSYTNNGFSLITTGEGHGIILLPKIKEYIFTFIQNIYKGEE